MAEPQDFFEPAPDPEPETPQQPTVDMDTATRGEAGLERLGQQMLEREPDPSSSSSSDAQPAPAPQPDELQERLQRMEERLGNLQQQPAQPQIDYNQMAQAWSQAVQQQQQEMARQEAQKPPERPTVSDPDSLLTDSDALQSYVKENVDWSMKQFEPLQQQAQIFTQILQPLLELGGGVARERARELARAEGISDADFDEAEQAVNALLHDQRRPIQEQWTMRLNPEAVAEATRMHLRQNRKRPLERQPDLPPTATPGRSPTEHEAKSKMTAPMRAMEKILDIKFDQEQVDEFHQNTGRR